MFVGFTDSRRVNSRKKLRRNSDSGLLTRGHLARGMFDRNLNGRVTRTRPKTFIENAWFLVSGFWVYQFAACEFEKETAKEQRLGIADSGITTRGMFDRNLNGRVTRTRPKIFILTSAEG